jgi:STAM-binding protein
LTCFSPTTTSSESSLPPHLDTFQYPSSVSQHQTSQGYHPSLVSTIQRPSQTPHSAFKTASFPRKIKTVSFPSIPKMVSIETKTVLFPRSCLDRFTSIALINTAQNQETCGLLLGKDEGCYVVTTLLIPKQHATSDTFVMNGEKLVMRFTEERSLIALGWVRRHLR